jgi:hypothetical protein
MAPIKSLADKVREDRRSVAADNSFLEFERTVSDQIVTALDSWRELVETAAEQTFLATYGSPLLQAAVGIEPGDQSPKRKAGKSPLHRELLQHRVADLRARIGIGGPREGAIRALLYAGMGRASVDERGFEAVRVIRATQDSVQRPALADFKALVREQYFMLLLDVQASIATLPDLLPEVDDRRKVLAAVRNVLSASGEIEGEVADRLQKLALVLGLDAKSVAAPRAAVSSVKRQRQSPRDEIGSSAVPRAVTARPRT